MRAPLFACLHPQLVGTKASSQTAEACPEPTSLSARIKLFEQQAAAAAAPMSSRSRMGAASGGHSSSNSGQLQQDGPHENCIISICPLDPPGRFLTASLEGCIAEWQVDL